MTGTHRPKDHILTDKKENGPTPVDNQMEKGETEDHMTGKEFKVIVLMEYGINGQDRVYV